MKPLACAAGSLLAALLPSAALAQPADAAPLQLTLQEAIRRGLETSHRVEEVTARGDAAEAAVGERHAATLPQLSALAGYTRTNHVDPFFIVSGANQLRIIYPDVPDNYRTRLDVQWPIYTGGRLDALERAARIEATASTDELATTRGDLTLEITRAFWAVVTTTEALRVVQESVTQLDAHLRDVRNQLAAGLVPPNDVLTVEARVSLQRTLASPLPAVVGDRVQVVQVILNLVLNAIEATVDVSGGTRRIAHQRSRRPHRFSPSSIDRRVNGKK